MKLGAIEAGGTKFICSIGDEFGNIQSQIRIETTSPEETLDKVIKFFENTGILAIGIGAFGPIDVNEKSNNYGCILNTPKVLWRNFNLISYLKLKINVPLFIDTDVDIACYGEYKKNYDKKNIIYMTVGTGIGCGVIMNNKILFGSSSPEMGHISIHLREGDNFKGVCPSHGNCLEGLASGPAILKRYGKKGEELKDRAEVWDLEGYYLAEAILNYTYVLTPDYVILGGGVGLLDSVIENTGKYIQKLNNNYIDIKPNYVRKASLGSNAGSVGGLLFAYDKLEKRV